MAPEQGRAPRRGNRAWYGVSAKRRILRPPSTRLNQPALLEQAAVESATVEIVGAHPRHAGHGGWRTGLGLRLELATATIGLLESGLLDSGTRGRWHS